MGQRQIILLGYERDVLRLLRRCRLARGELVELHLQEIIPSRSICLVYDHHRPLNTAARKFQQMLTKAEPDHPAAPKQAEGVSFISQ